MYLTPSHTMNNKISRTGQLQRITSSAGIHMTGFHAAAGSSDPMLICLHGLSGSLDTSFVFDLLSAPELASTHIVSMASSAHGNIALSTRNDPPGYYLSGSAFEFFTDSVADISAWVNYARQHTSGPIILLGHSLGASKVTHYLAHTQDPQVSGLVLASAPDLKGAFWAMHGAANADEFLRQAQEKVAAGQGRELMPETCVVGILRQRISAQTMVDRFAPGKAADTFDFFERQSDTAFHDLARITQPILSIYGSSGEIVGEGDVEKALSLLQQHARSCSDFSSLVLPANHWYVGSEPQLAQELGRWISTL